MREPNMFDKKRSKIIWGEIFTWISSSAETKESHFEVDRLLENITLTKKQVDIVTNNSKYISVTGKAGSGKSLALLSRMIGKILEEKSGRFLYVTYNTDLIFDVFQRFNKSPYITEINNFNLKNNIHFKTFHKMAEILLNENGIVVPHFKTTSSELRKMEDLMVRQIQRLFARLDTEEFKDYPSIKRIKDSNNTGFLRREFLWMKANNYITEESYSKCERKGRGNLPGISREQRKTIFRLFQIYCEEQYTIFHNRYDPEDFALKLIESMDVIPENMKFDHIFIDEAQDFQPMQFLALTMLCKGTLTLCGDQNQKIYKNSPYSYKNLGIEIDRSNSYSLNEIWRSTEQIMKLANSLHVQEFNPQNENGVFNSEGEKPRICHFKKYTTQIKFVSREIQKLKDNNINETVVIIHRLYNNDNLKALMNYLGQRFHLKNYNNNDGAGSGKYVYITDAHNVKGLEFDHVFIINFDDNHYPHKYIYKDLESNQRSSSILGQYYKMDEIEELELEKRILYVALTRAKKTLTLTFHGEDFQKSISRFSEKFNKNDYLIKRYQ